LPRVEVLPPTILNCSPLLQSVRDDVLLQILGLKEAAKTQQLNGAKPIELRCDELPLGFLGLWDASGALLEVVVGQKSGGSACKEGEG
jgi:hypothetical protein